MTTLDVSWEICVAGSALRRLVFALENQTDLRHFWEHDCREITAAEFPYHLLGLGTCDDHGNNSSRFYYHHSVSETFFWDVRLSDTVFSARFCLSVATCNENPNFRTRIAQWWLGRLASWAHHWLDHRLPEGSSAGDFRFSVVFRVFWPHKVDVTTCNRGSNLLPEMSIYQENTRAA